MQESNTVVNANKFTPKPGDKIICNNGEEFICCTLSGLQEGLAQLTNSNKPFFGQKEEFSERLDWDENGCASDSPYDEWNIREVIPQSSEVIDDKKEETKEEPRYTVDEVFDAIFEVTKHIEIEVPWDYIDDVKEHLSRKDDPQYLEFLRLKAIYG